MALLLKLYTGDTKEDIRRWFLLKRGWTQKQMSTSCVIGFMDYDDKASRVHIKRQLALIYYSNFVAAHPRQYYY
jgi:hypothetical protein